MNADDTAPWLTVPAAAGIADRHPVTMRCALERGELHGHQRRHRGRWRIHRNALDAWIRGERHAAAVDACGCARVSPRRRAS